MMFDFVPAFRAPTVTTPKVPGLSSRATIVCRRSTIALATTTGSCAEWGIEPWAPRPWIVTRSESPWHSSGPARVPMRPAAPGITCWASATSGRGIRSTRPSATIARAPWAVSSAGWNRAMKVPCQASRWAVRTRTAPSSVEMCTSWPQACMRPGSSEA